MHSLVIATRVAVCPDGVVPQQYPPDALVGRDYYRPTNRGVEAQLASRVAKLRAIIRRRG